MNTDRIRELLARVPNQTDGPLPNGVVETELDDFSVRTGLKMPGDLRQWLTVTNGPCIGPGGFFGIQPALAFLNIEMYLEMFPLWKEKGWIPIAGDGCGNYYVVATKGEFGKGFPVLFIDTSKGVDLPNYIVASDTEHFLVFLLENELGCKGWPFDKIFVSQVDPEIMRFSGVALPWTAS